MPGERDVDVAVDRDDGELEAVRRPVRPGDRRRGRVFAWIAVLFFALPVPAFAFGMRARPIENRPLASFPPVRFAWSGVDSIGVWFTDHLPFRQRAVELRAEGSQRYFHEAPPAAGGPASPVGGGGGSPAGGGAALGEAPVREAQAKRERTFLNLPPAPPEVAPAGSSTVIVGRDGWLFLTGELYKSCAPGQPRERVVAGLRRLQQMLERSGRPFTFTLAPNKSTAEPEYLPSSYSFSACGAAGRDATYAALTGAAIPGYVDARTAIAAREQAEGRDYYLRQDTHWNGLAEALIANTIAATFDPTVARGATVKESVGPYTGDLTTLLGLSNQDQGLFATTKRRGVTVTTGPAPLGNDSAQRDATTTRDPLLPGRTLLVGDSFAGGIVEQFAPYMQHLEWVHTGLVRQAPLSVANAIVASDRVALLWNERYFTDPAYGVLWSDAFLDRLEPLLAAAPKTPGTTSSAK